LNYCQDWFSPFSFSGTGGGVELYSNCVGISNNMLTPTNMQGYQVPIHENNYAGFYLIAGINGREYLEGKLSDTLQGGKKYCVRFYYSFAEITWLMTDGVGVLFTPDSLMRLEPDSAGLAIHLNPQVKQDSGYAPLDTVNWLLFEKEFVAQGGERFFTIGVFGDDSLHIIIPFNLVDPNHYCYAFFDSISVRQCDSPDAVVKTLRWQADLLLFPNPSNELAEINTNEPIDVITVFDAVGRVVYSGTDKIISTRPLPSGVYVVRVKMKNGLVAHRQLVVHR
jgi:hypothetical protein